MEIKVLDPETGEETPVGGVGELLFRGPSRFLYYHEDPETTAATIDAEGFFHTGDLVSREPDGAVGSSAGSRTCSRSAARTSRRPRSRATC